MGFIILGKSGGGEWGVLILEENLFWGNRSWGIKIKVRDFNIGERMDEIKKK